MDASSNAPSKMIVFAIAFLWAMPALGQTERSDEGASRATSQLTGQIDSTDLEDKSSSIPGAEIRFVNQDGKAKKSVAAENGRYRIALPYGRYEVTATHPDHKIYTTVVVVSKEQKSSTLNISMIPKNEGEVAFLRAGENYRSLRIYKVDLEGKIAMGDYLLTSPARGRLELNKDGKIVSKASYNWRQKVSAEAPASIRFPGYLSFELGAIRGTSNLYSIPENLTSRKFRIVKDKRGALAVGGKNDRGLITVSGAVYQRKDDGKIGPLIAGARVWFVSEDGSIKKNVHCKSGRYSIQLKPARYKVSATHPRFKPQRQGKGFLVVTRKGRNVSNFFLDPKE